MNKKKVCIIGQGEGGNAKLWFDYFNENIEFVNSQCKLFYVCQNQRQFDAKFRIFSVYGKKRKQGFLYNLYCSLFYRFLMSAFYYCFFKIIRPDWLIIQGNYYPAYNEKIIRHFNGDILLDIYGSDFYQNYFKYGKEFKKQFRAILDKAKYINCCWPAIQKDVEKEFPLFKPKLICISRGVTSFWKNCIDKNKTDKVIFLSARALYTYNNIDKLVEAFCIVYKDCPDYELNIINGYGNHQEMVNDVTNIINKYHCEKQVNFLCNEWISDDVLKQYYINADYNFCIGNTDVLTISIIYAYLTKTQNVLSPLDNYRQALPNMGFKSHYLLNEITLDSLISFFKDVKTKRFTINNEDIMHDYNLSQELDMDNTFKKYLYYIKS